MVRVNDHRGVLLDEWRPAVTLTAGLLLVGLLALAVWWLPRARFSDGSVELEAQRPSKQAAWTQDLTRTGFGAGRDTTVEVLFAVPEYFRLAGMSEEAALYRPEENLVFFVSEENHSGLFSTPPVPVLRFQDSVFSPIAVSQVVDSPHHRTTLFSYRREGSLAHVQHLPGKLEMVIVPDSEIAAARSTVSWQMPLGLPAAESVGGFGISGAGLLALFGGLLASMWPCLFQLTAYFIPTLAGLSVAEAGLGGAAVVKRQVLRTAFFFVLGIVVVYTLAGALAGYAAQSLAGSALFEIWSGPLTIVAAVFIIAMAVRVAVRARAPLVCKMPLVGHLAGNGPTGALGTMATGLAFATGCMTCFGAALALGMLTYVVSSASALTGALTLFVFSLGIAIPLVIGAVAMAQVLPLLGRLERIAPWMALASSGTMIAFALLLISGQYHAISTAIARLV